MGECIKREAAIAIIEEKQKELCPVGRYGRGYVYGSDREKYDAWDEIIDALEISQAPTWTRWCGARTANILTISAWSVKTKPFRPTMRAAHNTA